LWTQEPPLDRAYKPLVSPVDDLNDRPPIAVEAIILVPGKIANHDTPRARRDGADGREVDRLCSSDIAIPLHGRIIGVIEDGNLDAIGAEENRG
jgi:hypothetical protein